ncbi:MAG: hypothetical protein ACKPKO_18050, partial [Candidatus Fonsibacter sp.]
MTHSAAAAITAAALTDTAITIAAITAAAITAAASAAAAPAAALAGFRPGTFHWQVAPTDTQSNTRNCHQHISQMPHGLCHASHPHLRPRHCASYTANAPRR